MDILSTEELEMKRCSLQEQLAHVGDLRLGSLIYRYRRCGKQNCVCSEPGHPGHGGWAISKSVGGKTIMVTIKDEEDLPVVRGQLEEGRRFWKLAQEFAEVSDELSRARLSETFGKGHSGGTRLRGDRDSRTTGGDEDSSQSRRTKTQRGFLRLQGTSFPLFLRRAYAL